MVTLEELSALKKKVRKIQREMDEVREYTDDIGYKIFRDLILNWRIAVVAYNKAEREFLESL